jgi:hypothetical protein
VLCYHCCHDVMWFREVGVGMGGRVQRILRSHVTDSSSSKWKSDAQTDAKHIFSTSRGAALLSFRKGRVSQTLIDCARHQLSQNYMYTITTGHQNRRLVSCQKLFAKLVI